jgi:hypothetical protein
MSKAKIKKTKAGPRQSPTKVPLRRRTSGSATIRPKFFELPDGRKIPFDTRGTHELFGILGPPPAGRSLRVEEIDDIVAQAVAERRMGKK